MLRLEVGEHVVQRHPPPIAGALGRVAGAGVVDQDLAHGLGGGGEEVGGRAVSFSREGEAPAEPVRNLGEMKRLSRSLALPNPVKMRE